MHERTESTGHPNKLNFGVIFAVNSNMVYETVGLGDVKAINFASRMDQVIHHWKNTEELKPNRSQINGAEVLDIAAGFYYPNNNPFPPHFPRFASINGANVTTIQRHRHSNFDAALFKSIQPDLIPAVLNEDLDKLPELQKKFDIIHSYSFVGSNPDPYLIRRLAEYDQTLLTLFEIKLVDALAPLLKEDGIIDLDLVRGSENYIHRKVNGNLIEEKV